RGGQASVGRSGTWNHFNGSGCRSHAGESSPNRRFPQPARAFQPTNEQHQSARFGTDKAVALRHRRCSQEIGAKIPARWRKAPHQRRRTKELGKGMKGRIEELQGSTKPYEAYNEKFRTYYKMLEGIVGDMQEGLTGREGSIAQLKKFASANLD